MPIAWDAAMDQKLLLAILKTHQITLNHAAVADELGATPMAIQKRLQKIRETIKKGGSDAGTPVKAKAGGKRKTGGGGDDEEEPSPTKKSKGTPKSTKKATSAAAEDEVDDGEAEVKGVKQEPMGGGDFDDFN